MDQSLKLRLNPDTNPDSGPIIAPVPILGSVLVNRRNLPCAGMAWQLASGARMGLHKEPHCGGPIALLLVPPAYTGPPAQQQHKGGKPALCGPAAAATTSWGQAGQACG